EVGDMRVPDLLQLGYEGGLQVRSPRGPRAPVGPVRRQVAELVVEHDHHALLLAGRAGLDLGRAELREAGPRTGLGGRTGCPGDAGQRCDAERGYTERRSSLTEG